MIVVYGEQTAGTKSELKALIARPEPRACAACAERHEVIAPSRQNTGARRWYWCRNKYCSPCMFKRTKVNPYVYAIYGPSVRILKVGYSTDKYNARNHARATMNDYAAYVVFRHEDGSHAKEQFFQAVLGIKGWSQPHVGAGHNRATEWFNVPAGVTADDLLQVLTDIESSMLSWA